MRREGYSSCLVCVCLGGEESEFGISVRKEKVKRVREGRCGHCVGLCKGHPLWHIPTEFVWYMTMYTVSFLYKGILYLATKC